MNYRLAYAIGFHPWEELAEHPPFADKLLELVAREEDGHEPPYGPALDLGTGSGVWGVQLAQRGWEVTGVDIVEKALRRARERADAAGVEMRLVHGDVTALRQSEVGSGYRLVLDTGTFHGLTDAQREAMAREVTAVCADDATADARLLRAPAQRPAAPRREPRRRGARLPRAGRSPTSRSPTREPDAARPPVQVRRALLPAATKRRPHEGSGDRRDRQRGHSLAAAHEAHSLAGRELHVHRASPPGRPPPPGACASRHGRGRALALRRRPLRRR